MQNEDAVGIAALRSRIIDFVVAGLCICLPFIDDALAIFQRKFSINGVARDVRHKDGNTASVALAGVVVGVRRLLRHIIGGGGGQCGCGEGGAGS